MLNIEEDQIHEFFGAAEHPVLYCTCRNHQFHVPSYARVVIRDVDTLKSLDYEQPGLVNLMTPLPSSIPLLSVMTDDLGILHRGSDCGCGNPCDVLEILGRTGAADVKTCTAGAGEYLKGV